MDRTSLYKAFDAILLTELKPALGCTEPIAIAFASAAARKALGAMPDHITVYCSGNIIKNAMGVTVPNSSGMKGIPAAAVLGAVGGNPDKELEALSDITPEDIEEAKRLLGKDICKVALSKEKTGLYLKVECSKGEDKASAVIADCHDRLSSVSRNGKTLSSDKPHKEAEETEGKELLSVERIIDYASSSSLEAVRDALIRQRDFNLRIAEEGLKGYGACIGKTLMTLHDSSDVRVRASAYAAAGSDARMSGCPLPVVINSGSGNQGLTVSMPVVIWAEHLGKSEDETLRALAASNLFAIHQKKYIGALSAYCGAVSAAAGAAGAIAFMKGGDPASIDRAIANTLAAVGGIVCDGAKPSCAAKIAASLDAAILAAELAENGKGYDGEGLVKHDVERTIETFGKVGRDGMKETDEEILSLMLD